MDYFYSFRCKNPYPSFRWLYTLVFHQEKYYLCVDFVVLFNGTVNTLGVVLVMMYCAFLSLRTVLMALKPKGVNSVFLHRK